MDNMLGFLENDEPEAEAIAEEQQVADPAPVVEEPKDDRPRDEQGRFIPKQEEKPEPVMVPLAALQETRDKVRDLEARIAAQKPQEQPQSIPDVFEDPEGHTQAIIGSFEQRLYQERLNISGRFAVQQYGEEAVKEAVEWGRSRCATDPHFNAQILSDADPIGFTVQQYRRDQIASQVSADDFAKFKAWQAAQAEVAQQAVTPPPQQQALPTPSMATASSAGGVAHVPTGPGQAYDQLFRN